MKILKKMLVGGIGLICVSLVFVVSTIAGTFSCNPSGCNPSDGSLDFKCSKNVRINCNSDGQSYAATSGHYSGNKAYGVSSDSSVVYYTDKDKGSQWTSNPSSPNSSAFNSWHSL